MKKILSILIAFFICYSCFSQGGWTTPNAGSYGTIVNRGSFIKAILLPTGSGAPTTLDAYDLHQFALKGDSVGHQMYYYDPSLQTWSVIGSGGGGGSANILDSVVLTFDGLHPETSFATTETGFKTLSIEPEDEKASGFIQAFSDVEAVLQWQVAIKGQYKFYITYYY